MRTRIALICTVWGTEFTDFFCQYSLATLLCPTNLPSACAEYEFTLLLYTTEDDLGHMRAHGNFHQLSTLIQIRPVLLDTLLPAARTGHWIQWHHAVLCSEEFSASILLIPDCLYANDALPQIAKALETSDFVFYCIPQVCIEPLLPSLQASTQPVRGDISYYYLNLSEREIAGLFVKFINPRYAVALDRPNYFVTHPEYLLRASGGQIEIHELIGHALAVSSRAKNISYAFNPMSDCKAAFLGLLAVGVEYTFKYFEQYYRWAALGMQSSRQTTLASWSYTFFERGFHEYNKTKTEITVNGLEASALRRAPVSSPRVKYTRAAFQYYAASYAIHAGPAAGCSVKVRQALALAISLPGFRKLVMSQGGQLTILLPISEDASVVLDRIYDLGDAQILFRFLLVHILPGRLTLKAGQTFVLEQTISQPPYRPRFRIADSALTENSAASITGQVAALGTYLNDGLVAYPATIRYRPDLLDQLQDGSLACL